MAAENLTLDLARVASQIKLADLPPDIRTLVKQCVLDFLGVTIAGADTDLVRILREELATQGGNAEATIIGSAHRVSTHSAALVNGTASHALDYDDVNYALMGHPTVPVLPALLALAEQGSYSGAEVMVAFVAGYEFECRVGLAVAPGHYARGFHATATLGALGAAAACARLLGLDAATTAHAVGIAATQAAGLKSMFGTDCKPLHAGHAARNGLLAAGLAARGFGSRLDSLECAQGFIATHSPDSHSDAARATPRGGFHLHTNLFKYHASCYETHAAIECARALRAAVDIEHLREVVVTVNPYCDKICNIAAPTTGLEAKFSLRQTVAFALADRDTADPYLFVDANVRDPSIQSLRDKVRIELSDRVAASQAQMQVTSTRGGAWRHQHDASIPATDLAAQEIRLRDKFRRLVVPLRGETAVARMIQLCERLEEQATINDLLSATRIAD